MAEYFYGPEQKRLRRSRWLQRAYGITVDDFDLIFEKQGFACALCGSTTKNGRGNFVVDHCHEYGHNRAILCGKCNKGLGLFNEDPELLSAAAEYLIKHQGPAQ